MSLSSLSNILYSRYRAYLRQHYGVPTPTPAPKPFPPSSGVRKLIQVSLLFLYRLWTKNGVSFKWLKKDQKKTISWKLHEIQNSRSVNRLLLEHCHVHSFTIIYGYFCTVMMELSSYWVRYFLSYSSLKKPANPYYREWIISSHFPSPICRGGGNPWDTFLTNEMSSKVSNKVREESGHLSPSCLKDTCGSWKRGGIFCLHDKTSVRLTFLSPI